MEFKNRAIAPMVAAILYTTATAAMAQVGEIPERFSQYNHGHDMMWGSNQWGGFGMVLGPIFMILIVVGIVAAIIYLLRLFGAAGPATSSHAAHDRALALLKERYAKGEIDSTEFAERKKLLAD
ncbi:MAG: putative membrane protein [Sulfitobacter sp.]|jgi:putative membrane protein|uniref:SHOCT domain-containing protein n=1 Tax=Sulfitobacter sp. TaxID=1903071 RepID=UPI0039E2AA67